MPPTEEPRLSKALHRKGALPPRPDVACRACGHLAQHHVEAGVGPHAARLVCETCGHFIKWLPKRLYVES
jgi:hypothetical protein